MSYGAEVHSDRLENGGHRLLIARDRYGAYILDVEPSDEDTEEVGVHVYLTARQLISLGASIQAEIEAQGLS